MSRRRDDPLEIKTAIAEGCESLGTGLWYEALELVHVPRNPNAPTAASGRRLDHYGKTDALHDLDRFGMVDPIVRTRYCRDTGCSRRLPCRHFVAHEADRLGAGPHKNQSGIADRLGKSGILRQKSITWMDGIRAGSMRCLQDDR